MKIERLGDPARHFWMTRSVARAMGVSLSDAMADGSLSKEKYAEMVTECRRCDVVEQCELWLAAQADHADLAPQGCRNAEILHVLKRNAAA